MKDIPSARRKNSCVSQSSGMMEGSLDDQVTVICNCWPGELLILPYFGCVVPCHMSQHPSQRSSVHSRFLSCNHSLASKLSRHDTGLKFPHNLQGTFLNNNIYTHIPMSFFSPTDKAKRSSTPHKHVSV